MPGAAESRTWVEIAAGVAVAALGVHGMLVRYPVATWERTASVSVAVAMGAAVALYRLRPSVAVLLAWWSCLVQLFFPLQASTAQLGVLLVAFGAGRYGGAVTVWVSGLSIPFGARLAVEGFRPHMADRAVEGAGVLRQVLPFQPPASATASMVPVMAILLVPYIMGLLVRSAGMYRVSSLQREQAQAEAERAQEIAALRANQARLANDVHDVVGHSLAVIVAQADAAGSLGENDFDRVREAVANIATTARRSLGDVRQVLSAAGSVTAPAPRRTGTLGGLVESVRGAGHDVRDKVVGRSRPLPPDIDHVAYRVLQEMLTNALKHGSRSEPITVLHQWGDDELRMDVVNAVADPGAHSSAVSRDGMGVPGMRRRLAVLGGGLELRRIDEGDGVARCRATAWLPVRPPRGGGEA